MTKLLKNAGIYVLCNRNNGNCYVGKDENLGSRAKRHLALKDPGCEAIHNAIKKHGANNFDVELIRYPNISHEALCEVETWKIRQLRSHRSQGGYNLTFGGDGLDPETAREIARKQVADGTHHWLGDNNPVHKQMAEGTHNFQDSGFHKTHREVYQENGREVNRKRVADGTHPFLGGEIQSESNRKRVAEGTHNFLGDNNPNHKRITDGTHNFFDPQVRQKRLYAHRLAFKNRRREFYQWVSVILTAKSVCEERIYQKHTREGFFDKEIPDTSKSKQLDLF